MKTLSLAILFIVIPVLSTIPHTAAAADAADAAFQEALAFREAGDAAEAAAIFKSLLAKDPSLQRVRLELAVCHEQLGERAEANRLYQQVLAAKPPEAVQRNVQERLRAMNAGMMLQPPADGQRAPAAPAPNVPGENSAGRAAMAPAAAGGLTLSGEVAAGMIYDMNVNVGPTSDTVTIFDLPFTLDPSARPTADWGYQARANVFAQYALNARWSLHASLAYDRVDYFEQDLFDFDRASASAGPVLSGGAWQVALYGGYGANWLGRELYSQEVSVTPQWTWQFRPQWTSTFTLSAAIGMNDQNDGYSGESAFVSESVQWTSQNGRTFVRPRIFYARDQADADFLASHQVGGGIGLFTALPWSLSFYVEPSARLAQYDGIEPLYGETRREPQFVVNANLARPLGIWGLEAALGYTFTRNTSNVEQFDYERSQFTFLIRKGW